MKTKLISNSADNAEITINITANAGEAIYISSLSCSYNGTVSGMQLHVEDGGTVVWSIDVPDASGRQFDWTNPLKMTAGNDAKIVLTASGTGGTVGTLNVAYGKGE